MAAISLTISVHDVPTPPCRPALVERLNRSPAASPTAEDLQKRYDAAAALHLASVEAVKERAARDVARAKEAKLRKLRAQATAAAKIQTKLSADDAVIEKRKAELKAKFEAQRAKRASLAAAFHEARRTAAAAAKASGLEKASRGEAAACRRDKALAAQKEHAAYKVKHALAVAAAQKEKARTAAANLSTLSSSRLQAAEARRESALDLKIKIPEAGKPSPRSPETGGKTRYAVYNDDTVARALRRKSLEAQMDKAAANRAAAIDQVVSKASTFNTRAAEVAASVAVQEKKEGLEKRSYERMVSAEVSRLNALKTKASGLKAKAPTGSPRAAAKGVAFDLDTGKRGTKPPSALLARLTRTPSGLLASAASRQAGASARRAAAAADATARLARASAKLSAATRRRATALAAKTDKAAAKAARSELVLALKSKRASVGAAGRADKASAARNARAALRTTAIEKGKAELLRANAADSRRAKSLASTVASAKRVGDKAKAFATRRDALDIASKGAATAKADRCAAAAAAKAALLSALVAKLAGVRRNEPVKLTKKPSAADGEVDIVFVEAALSA